MIKTVTVTHSNERAAMAYMSAMTYLGYDAIQIVKVDGGRKTFATIDMFGEPDDVAGDRLENTAQRILDGKHFPDKPETKCADCGQANYRAAMVQTNFETDEWVCRFCYSERGKDKPKTAFWKERAEHKETLRRYELRCKQDTGTQMKIGQLEREIKDIADILDCQLEDVVWAAREIKGKVEKLNATQPLPWEVYCEDDDQVVARFVDMGPLYRFADGEDEDLAVRRTEGGE